VAHAYPYANSAQALYWPAFGPTFFDAWNAQDMSNRDLLCAEMCRLAYAERQMVADVLKGVGFDLRHWIGGETAAQRAATGGTDGFIATSQAPALTVLAFRGTESNKPEDILTDALAASVPWKPKNGGRGNVHRGFAQVYELVVNGISGALPPPGGELLVTGHSLGAGLATLAAADLAARRPVLVTFGSPRVGDGDFKQLLASLTVHRFVDCCDLVTRIPPTTFEEADIAALLHDFVPASLHADRIADFLVGSVSAALARLLRALGVQPQYEHVGEAIYRDRDGRAVNPQTPAAIAQDQAAARAAYHGSVTPDLRHLIEELGKSLLAAGGARDASAVRAAIRHFGARLFQGDPVPLRDLADHAPINYVSLFTGRG
jgi:triacylglycerol lipase